MLTLAEAKKTGRLQEFISQEEARGVGAVSKADFDRLIGAAVKSPQATGQTSRSVCRDSSALR
jgi:hypothetical protein